MSFFKEYANYDGLGLAELVRRKQVTPPEILDAALARISALNPKLGCVPLRMDDAARKQLAAGRVYGPFMATVTLSPTRAEADSATRPASTTVWPRKSRTKADVGRS